MWIYAIQTGELVDPSGATVGYGYSGNGADFDCPAAEDVIGHGPIPEGRWVIGPFETYPHLGEIVAPLTPGDGNNMDGREGGFFIHGDNPDMNHTASDGCVVLSRPLREAIAASDDHVIQVVAYARPSITGQF